MIKNAEWKDLTEKTSLINTSQSKKIYFCKNDFIIFLNVSYFMQLKKGL